MHLPDVGLVVLPIEPSGDDWVFEGGIVQVEFVQTGRRVIIEDGTGAADINIQIVVAARQTVLVIDEGINVVALVK